jgi:hypothetical protein
MGGMDTRERRSDRTQALRVTSLRPSFPDARAHRILIRWDYSAISDFYFANPLAQDVTMYPCGSESLKLLEAPGCHPYLAFEVFAGLVNKACIFR